MSANSNFWISYVERYNAGDLDGGDGSVRRGRRPADAGGHLRGAERDPRAPRPGTGRVPGHRLDGRELRRAGRRVRRRVDVRGDAHRAVPAARRHELPPTGKRVEITGMEYVQMRDGKIVVDNLYYDNLAVMTQLGLVRRGPRHERAGRGSSPERTTGPTRSYSTSSDRRRSSVSTCFCGWPSWS